MSYNPMIDYKRNELMAQQAMIQQQLAQLNQMSQPQMQPLQQVPQNNQQTQYFVREIGNFDEAKRIVPGFGEIYVLIDGTCGKIYLKQMNPDTGKSDYLFYNIDNTEKEEAKDPMAVINERLTKIENSIGGLYESISGNGAGPEPHAEPDGGNDGTDEGKKSAAVQSGTADDKRKK